MLTGTYYSILYWDGGGRGVDSGGGGGGHAYMQIMTALEYN